MAIQMLVPDYYVFTGSYGHTRLWLILHKTAGFHSAQDVATYFQAGAPQPDGTLAMTSVHYVIGQDGVVVQCVRETDGAGGNGILESGHDPWWTINPNLVTFSIEHVDPSRDNSTPLTDAQKLASFQLQYDLCRRWKIPMRPADATGGITGHFSIDPLSRKNCPGNYPWDELWIYFKGQEQSMVKLSSTGEVAGFAEADQFPPGKSQFECGYFACMMARSMAQVGKPPTLNAQQITDQAETWYARDHGDNTSSNTDGMSVQEEYDLLVHLGLHYQSLPLDMNNIKAWLTVGYPVVVAIEETSVYDLDLGSNPYPWTPAGNHVILLTGLSGGNVLARDSANCQDLNDPTSLRPGPRHYDASQLSLVSATIVVPPWMNRPIGQTPKEGFIMPVPTGWTDDKTKLTSPGGHYAVGGMRTHILNANWDANDVLLEEEQQVKQVELHNANNPGARQLSRNRLLVYTKANGVQESAAGLEIAECYRQIVASSALLAAAQAQVATLQAQFKDLQQVLPVDVLSAQAALKALGTALLSEGKALSDIAIALHVTL